MSKLILMSLVFFSLTSSTPTFGCSHGCGGPGAFRPVCRIGFVHPGCVAPVRKGLRLAGRAVGRVGLGVARGVRFALFGPRRRF